MIFKHIFLIHTRDPNSYYFSDKMAMKGYPTLPRASELEPIYQMHSYPTAMDTVSVF